MLNNFLFIGLPYIALAVMLAGTIIRYRVAGFSVSSLSSQFLESNDLFRGIRPFHWGILLLFSGHLSGFLFPRTVVLLGAIPIRLFIIEASAFGFGLLTLYGLTMLIIRRLQHERLYAVTTPMDVSVYLILSLQIISGLWVAFFARWGSVWFASAIAPYLKSIFTFSPDIAAVSAMPLSVKIHVVSAFILIGMIPFTRFMHFLVYPFAYLWRSYQYVIWNWDRNKIRSSGRFINIARPRNN
jgi:nitrate reductase gamma subunit